MDGLAIVAMAIDIDERLAHELDLHGAAPAFDEDSLERVEPSTVGAFSTMSRSFHLAGAEAF
ncbi:MAG TPA: hypothetical protein VK841_12910 [Polyangiaceae bacterium]|nr:hypothetical protein [Polyangiaceae bacterium]